METSWEFKMPEAVIYGQGALSKLGKYAAQYGSKALLISDQVMVSLGHADKCRVLLSEAGMDSAGYLEVNTEPTDRHVAEALDICLEEGCDVIVSIGGGSCIDTAKAISVLASNGGYIGEYMGGRKIIENPPLPHISIPTTAGTGSEVTNATIITNPKEDIKMMIKADGFLPKAAIVDPQLTLSTPAHVTAATGIDALCHAIEALMSKKSQPLTRTLALSAITGISGNLRKAYENGDDAEAREKMAIASMEAGMAFTNASVALVHGMSRPIGALFHVPHGISNAMLLPAVLEFTKQEAEDALAEAGRIFSPELMGASAEQYAEAAIASIKELCLDLGIPNMKTWGIDEKKFTESLDKMASDALASGSPANNPRVPDHQEIMDLYQTCYSYHFTNKTAVSQ